MVMTDTFEQLIIIINNINVYFDNQVNQHCAGFK